MKMFGHNFHHSFNFFCFVLIASVFFSTLSSAQNEDVSVQIRIQDHNQSNIMDLPVSYEKSEQLLRVGEMASALESYYVIDDSIFSVADFLAMVAEKFQNDNPWINIRELEFRLHEHYKYVSLKGRLYINSEFFYIDEKQIERIRINAF